MTDLLIFGGAWFAIGFAVACLIGQVCVKEPNP